MDSLLRQQSGEEKKVEYLELIYDLIFAYFVTKNNDVILHTQNGFISMGNFLGYIMGTLIILEIWYMTTTYINRYGTNGIAEHVTIFINMYLLYYMAESTSVAWANYHIQYAIAWALILINLGVQFLLKSKMMEMYPHEHRHTRYIALIMFVQAGLILLSLVWFAMTGVALANCSMVFWFVAILVLESKFNWISLDFTHLSERVMLFVVVTFGSMLTGIADFFDNGMSFAALYYSVTTFLCVIGLLVIYGHYYNKLLDRQRPGKGMAYILLHVGLILALNNITTALILMPKVYVSNWAKVVFLAASVVLYFAAMLALSRFTYQGMPGKRHLLLFCLMAAVYLAAMSLSALYWILPPLFSAIYIYLIFLIMVRIGRQEEENKGENSYEIQ